MNKKQSAGVSGDELRESFLDFFKERGHTVVASSSLIPRDDPTLLFTVAGVVQFKPFYTGAAALPYARAASIQKCLRVSDLENVGKTRRHLTFFEMLGNFSFGDYFKEDAIAWAWEYLVEKLGVDRKMLYVSVHRDDADAYDIWRKKAGLEASRIFKLGDRDNFWGPAGNTGPCGPCSEIYFDLGSQYSCGDRDCAPGCDCERFIEIWNLVFPQFDQQISGQRLPLKNRGVDTGMGFERLLAILQNRDTNFHTDVFYPIVESITKRAGVNYGQDPRVGTSVNVIADHCRALVMGIGDGIIPSNEERGYVLRRLLRRAVRLARSLKAEGPFLYNLVPAVIETFKHAYPGLSERREEIMLVIKSEEERFLATLDKGLLLFEEILKKNHAVSDHDAFKLYDTYGFPLELTVELSRERGIAVDEKGFYEMLEQARHLSRTRAKFVPRGEWKVVREGTGTFVGYEKSEAETEILRYNIYDDAIDIVLKECPFYAESGGQIGETGTIGGPGFTLEVIDTYSLLSMAVCHCRLVKGRFAVAAVHAAVDVKRRLESARAHTCTHLLHAALRRVLGEHARQEGSFVEPGRFRFDFTHFSPLDEDELAAVEALVNEKILEDRAVEKFYTSLDEAKKMGALAFFGEKYGEQVRVVRIGDYSIELCGGVHLERTGEIGMFRIRSQESAAAGVRRIEAVVGMRLYEETKQRDRTLKIIADIMGGDAGLIDRITELQNKLKISEKRVSDGRLRTAQGEAQAILKEVEMEKYGYLLHEFKDLGTEALRLAADLVRSKAKNLIGVFYEETGGRINFLVFCGDAVVADHPANKLVKQIAGIWGGGGGGRPDLAEGGGGDPKKIRLVAEFLEKVVKDRPLA